MPTDIEERLAKHRGEIQRLIEERETATAAERTELTNRIKVLEDQIKADKEAKEQKEKDEGSGGTLVLPPEQVPQGQQHGDKEGEHGPAAEGKIPEHEGSSKRRLHWW